MASPHHPQHPRHPSIPGGFLPSSSAGSSPMSASSSIPFNTSAHNFNAPSPLSFGFGGVNLQSASHTNGSNANMSPATNHSLGFGGFTQPSAASSSSRVSSPLATSFGFGGAPTSTGTGSQSPQHQQWASPQYQQPYHSNPNPNPFAQAFASSSSTSHSINHSHQTPISPSPARTVNHKHQHQASHHGTSAHDSSSCGDDNDGGDDTPISSHQRLQHGKRRRSPSDDDMDRSSPTPSATATPLPSINAASTQSGSTSLSLRSLKRPRADPEAERQDDRTNDVDEKGHHQQHDRGSSTGNADTLERHLLRDVRARREGGSDGLGVEDGASHHGQSGDEADLGVLLASLPSTTHLQILHALLSSHPSLKPAVLDLIPAPEIGFAIRVLDEKVAKLVEAVPIGAGNTGGGPGPGAARRTGVSGNGATFGFGSGVSTATTNARNTSKSAGTVSDGYLLNRIRIPFTDFVNVVLTYLPYFVGSSLQSVNLGSASGTSGATTTTPSSSAGGRQITAPHPSVTFQYLSHLTALLIQRVLPVLPSSILHSPTSSSSPSTITNSATTLPHLPILLRALENAWNTWLTAISDHVNAQAGMYAASMAQDWISGIEALAEQAAVLLMPPSPGAASGIQDQQQMRKMDPLARVGANRGLVSGMNCADYGNRRGENHVLSHNLGGGSRSTPSSSTATVTTSSKTDLASPATMVARSLALLAEQWVVQVGWLIGRSPGKGEYAQDTTMSDRMDEEL